MLDDLHAGEEAAGSGRFEGMSSMESVFHKIVASLAGGDEDGCPDHVDPLDPLDPLDPVEVCFP
jgi:hypothetical protein